MEKDEGKKTSIKNLQNVPHFYWSTPDILDSENPARYTAEIGGDIFDFIVSPKEETGRLIVFFSGNAKRSMFDPPVFQRWSWARKFPATCVYFSDPALYKSEDLGLAWYAGGESQDHLAAIWETVGSIVERLAVPSGSVFSYASSGGGLAALRSAVFFPGLHSITINPRISLWKKPEKWISRFTRTCYGAPDLRSVSQEHWHKFAALDSTVLASASSIFLAQNELDTLYLKNQYTPFMEFVKDSPQASKLETHIFRNEAGHAAAEDEGTFQRILAHIEEVS